MKPSISTSSRSTTTTASASASVSASGNREDFEHKRADQQDWPSGPQAKKWKEILSPPPSDEDIIELADLPAYYKKSYLYQPIVYFYLLEIILLSFSFFERFAFLLFLSLFFFLVFHRLRTRARLSLIQARRIKIKKVFWEGEKAEFFFEIENLSPSSIENLIIEDECHASLQFHVALRIGRTLEAGERLRIRYQRLCNAGMGEHQVGPLRLRITDSLGIFEYSMFCATEDVRFKIDVYPQPQHLPELKMHASPNSSLLGVFETATRGLSVNFSGVRPYSMGDPLRFVAWKLSQKNQGLQVKEFEKSVNAEINLLLNIDRSLLTGHGSANTWELAKDAAVALLHQQLEQGNSVGLIHPDHFLEMGSGREHFHRLVSIITDSGSEQDALRARTDGVIIQKDQEHAGLLTRHMAHFRSGTTLIYISPFQKSDAEACLPYFKELLTRGIWIFVVLIDTRTFMADVIMSLAGPVAYHMAQANGIDAYMQELKLLGIEVYKIEHKDRSELYKAFQQKAV